MKHLEMNLQHNKLHTAPARRAPAIFGIAAASMMLLAGCLPATPAPASTVPVAAETATPAAAQAGDAQAGDAQAVVTINIDAEGLTAPAEVASGPVTIEFVNSTEAGGSPMIARFVEGKTIDDLMAAMGAMETAGPGALFDAVRLYGGAEGPAVGSLTLDLAPGSHIALLMGEGMPQFATFEVVEGEATAAPEADIEAAMADFTFLLPDAIATGPQVWRFTNEGEQWHETVIFKLEEGQTVDELIEAASAAGPEGSEEGPEMAMVWTPMSQGEEGWATVDLAAGEYVVICFLPDLNGDMSPHFAHGMVRTLTVQ